MRRSPRSEGTSSQEPEPGLAADRPTSKVRSYSPARKRSITVRPDLDDAVIEAVGKGHYSKFINDAVILGLQARGISDSLAEFEAQHGPLLDQDIREAEERIARAYAEAAR